MSIHLEASVIVYLFADLIAKKKCARKRGRLLRVSTLSFLSRALIYSRESLRLTMTWECRGLSSALRYVDTDGIAGVS